MKTKEAEKSTYAKNQLKIADFIVVSGKKLGKVIRNLS